MTDIHDCPFYFQNKMSINQTNRVRQREGRRCGRVVFEAISAAGAFVLGSAARNGRVITLYLFAKSGPKVVIFALILFLAPIDTCAQIG
jgi:hypothetical protein